MKKNSFSYNIVTYMPGKTIMIHFYILFKNLILWWKTRNTSTLKCKTNKTLGIPSLHLNKNMYKFWEKVHNINLKHMPIRKIFGTEYECFVSSHLSLRYLIQTEHYFMNTELVDKMDKLLVYIWLLWSCARLTEQCSYDSVCIG